MGFTPVLHRTHPKYTKPNAVFSDDGRYRYLLTWRWGEGPLLGLIGLNPSTVRAQLGAPSERWFRNFAKSRGFAGYTVANLYAGLGTDLKHLGELADPVGPDDDAFIDQMAATHDIIVFAWGGGADPRRARSVASRVWRACGRRGGAVAVFGWTVDEQPIHPLCPPGTAALQTLTAGTHPDPAEIDRRWTRLLDGTTDLDDAPVNGNSDQADCSIRPTQVAVSSRVSAAVTSRFQSGGRSGSTA